MTLYDLRSGSDNFVFETTPLPMTLLEPIDGQSALVDALTARGIDTSILRGEQIETLSDFAKLLDTVTNANLETGEDAVALLGDQLNITLVDDLRTTDGQKLNGAASEDGKIYLDADLKGTDLSDVLAEEVAETAFQKAFEATSKGDFGAEVVARIQGQDDLEQFVADNQNDSVLTEFGAAQAAKAEKDEIVGPIGGGETQGSTQKQAELDRLVDHINKNNPNDIVVFDAEYVSKEEVERIRDGAGDYPYITDENNQSVFGTAFYERYEIPVDFDPDGDGKGMSVAYAFADLTSLDVRASGLSDVKILPVSGISSTLIAGSGEAETRWEVSKGEEFTISEEVNWKFGMNVEGSGGIDGLFSIGGGASGETGGAVVETDTVTAKEAFTRVYRVDGDDYEKGAQVSFGWHAMRADIERVTETYNMYFEIEQEDGGETVYIKADVTETGSVDDFLVSLVATDFEIGEPIDFDRTGFLRNSDLEIEKRDLRDALDAFDQLSSLEIEQNLLNVA